MTARYYRAFAGTYNEHIYDSVAHLVWWVNPDRYGDRTVVYCVDVPKKGLSDRWDPL